jgi:plastocyanin domain-containing protein
MAGDSPHGFERRNNAKERTMRSMETKRSGIGILLAAFLVAGCAGQKKADTGAESGASEPIALSVTTNGFEPNQVRVKAGQPVTLAVTRKTDQTCATELVLKEYGINQKLPLNETVTIQFTPTQAGQLTYACGMNMFKGTIVVE